MNDIVKIIEKMDPKDQKSVGSALAEAMNNNNVKVGSTVAVVQDPTYPFDGLKGTVLSMEKGYANVEFDNKIKAELHVNLLIPV
jgi:hypothetical protein